MKTERPDPPDEQDDATPGVPGHAPDVSGTQRNPIANLPGAGPGRPPATYEGLSDFIKSPRPAQQQVMDTEWAELSYILVNRAKKYARTATKRDFGRIVQIATAAGIARDKVFFKPAEVRQSRPNLVVNLFGNMAVSAIRQLVAPAVPVGDTTPPNASTIEMIAKEGDDPLPEREPG